MSGIQKSPNYSVEDALSEVIGRNMATLITKISAKKPLDTKVFDEWRFTKWGSYC